MCVCVEFFSLSWIISPVAIKNMAARCMQGVPIVFAINLSKKACIT